MHTFLFDRWWRGFEICYFSQIKENNMMRGAAVKQALLTFHRIHLNSLNHNAVCRLCLKSSHMHSGQRFETSGLMIGLYSYYSSYLYLYFRRHSPGAGWAGITNGDVSWIVSTLRSTVPASLHLLVLQLKPSLCGLRAPEHPLFTPSSLLVLIQVMRRGHKG